VITPAPLRSKYVALEGYLDFARTRVRDTISRYCEDQGYAFVSRIKTLASLSEKIESGRFEKWSDLDDLIACAIVVPTLADEQGVLDFLEQAFEKIAVKRRGSAKKSPEVFRFDTTRFVGKLHRPEDIASDEPAYQIVFEIQVRSAFEHAWVVTTHALTYKAEEVAWSRLRLTAQLKASVEQLDILVLGFEQSSAQITSNVWPETQAKADLTRFFKTKFDTGEIPEELSPKDWTRFGDNIYGMVRASPWGRRRPPLDIATEVVRAMENAIGALGRDKIPVSISLVQFVFAALFDAGVIAAPLSGYCPVITNDLENLYPALGAFESRFDFAH
jgi:ppGpp synthetase/RelA/SpoT-type nucleotidyltranferase